MGKIKVILVLDSGLLFLLFSQKKEEVHIMNKANSGECDVKKEDNRAEALANGAQDVVVVARSTGELQSTGWFGQVGKFHSLFHSREGKEVAIFVGSVPARPRMIISESGTFKFKSCGQSPSSSPNLMSSQDLKELNLQKGINKAKYVIQELDEVIEFDVYLFSEDDKIVVSDIDGTITESDVKGHVYTLLGLDVHHHGVVSLYDGLASRGYKLVYLTARSMAMEEDTKSYLSGVKNQEGKTLPQGPVFFSPNALITGLITEVTGSPHLEKTSSLLDLWATFKSKNRTDINEVIQGAYGNKETDNKAYLQAGLLPHKVFIVNPSGELKNIGSGEVSSYQKQAETIDELYPFLN